MITILTVQSFQKLIYKEFFTQGDLEKAMGVMPNEMMDREKARIPRLQINFLEQVVLPVYRYVYIHILCVHICRYV